MSKLFSAAEDRADLLSLSARRSRLRCRVKPGFADIPSACVR